MFDIAAGLALLVALLVALRGWVRSAVAAAEAQGARDEAEAAAETGKRIADAMRDLSGPASARERLRRFAEGGAADADKR